MFAILTQHQFWAAVVAYWIFSAAVSAMPEPAANGSPAYLCFYRFLHSIAGNITTAFAEAARYRASASRGNKIPGLKNITVILLVPVLLSASACRAHYAVHPGALNTADSAAYDTLLIAEATIDQARTAYETGRLPVGAKEPLNALIHSYNLARQSWLTYRGAIATAQRKRDSAQPQVNVPPDIYFDELTKNLKDLMTAIRILEEAK